MGNLDVLCEFAIDFLLSKQGDARRLAVTLAEHAPGDAPSDLILILASAAASIEEVFSGPESHDLAVETWRIAALLGVDLHMMRVLGHSQETCADLLQYWRHEDGYFLS